ncbi:MAG: hypothetical protein WAM68_04060 [Acidobacteriaceae bacterium]
MRPEESRVADENQHSNDEIPLTRIEDAVAPMDDTQKDARE